MANLAERLGRRFEARVLLTLAIAAAPDRDDLRRELARLGKSLVEIVPHGRTLAEVVAIDRDDEKTIGETPRELQNR